MNVEKSSLVPVRRLLYIEAILDSCLSMAFHPLERAQTLRSLADQICSSPTSSALRIQCLLGHMAAAIIVVPFARRHMRPIQLWFLRSFRLGVDSQSKPLRPPAPVRESLMWWTCLDNLLVGVPSPQLTLTTDASLWGWGAHLATSCARGPWPTSLCNKLINYLELLAIFLPLREFQSALRGKVVQVFSDNTTAV